MDTTPFRITGAVLLFLLIFASGYWLSRSGKPYSVIVLTIHKLIALAAFVFLVIILIQSHRVTPLSGTEMVAGTISGLFFLGLIISGGLLSSDAEIPALVSKLHEIAPYLTVLSGAATLYLLHGRG
jgi:hypothetical protein